MAAGMSAPDISGWLPRAIDHIAVWLGFQMRVADLLGNREESRPFNDLV
jgi:hypothetical protein